MLVISCGGCGGMLGGNGRRHKKEGEGVEIVALRHEAKGIAVIVANIAAT